VDYFNDKMFKHYKYVEAALRQTCTREVSDFNDGRKPTDQNKVHPPFLFVSWTKQSLITNNKTNYINNNMHISDYMFQRLNGHLQAVYIHKHQNYVFKYHFIGLHFLKVF